MPSPHEFSPKTEKLLGAGVWLVPLAIYLALPTREFYWDGVAFAIRIEKAAFNPRLIFHPNHLLYEALGYKLYTLLGQIGFPVRALFLLQALNSVAASLCVLVLYLALTETSLPRFGSLSLALLFAFSGTWWRFAADADAYVFSIFFLLLAWSVMAPSRLRPARFRPLAAGLLQSLSMLFHELGVFFYPAAAMCLWQQPGPSLRRRLAGIVEYTAAAALPTLAVYTYVYCTYVVNSAERSPGFLEWITDHSQDASFSFKLARNAALTLLGTVRLFFTGQIRLAGAGPVELTGLALLGIVTAFLAAGWRRPATVVAALLSRETAEKLRARAPLLAWIGAYLAFLFFWLPQNTFYRLFYLPPLILLAGALLESPLDNDQRERGTPASLSTRHNWRGSYQALAVAAVFLWNFSFSVYPRAQTANNPVLGFALQQQPAWPAGTGVAFRRFDSDLWTICYFNPQASWIGLGPSDLATLDRYRDQLGRDGRGLWIDGSAFDDLQSTAAGKNWAQSHIDFGKSLDRQTSGRRFRFYRVDGP